MNEPLFLIGIAMLGLGTGMLLHGRNSSSKLRLWKGQTETLVRKLIERGILVADVQLTIIDDYNEYDVRLVAHEHKGLTLDEYMQLAMRTRNPDVTGFSALLEGAMGCSGEAGELLDELKKVAFHGHDLDKDKLLKELGDNLWYTARTADALGVSLEDVARRNIEKLRARYPHGFSAHDSKNRSE
jgi:NTP pyrophosphatase (non-canonical NTP hydrolase)